MSEEQALPETPGVVPEEAPPSEASASEADALRQELEEERKKSAETYDQYVRSVAELRNYKKRVDQEREQWAREANAGLIGRLLSVLDDLERAMAVLPDEKLLHLSWIEGIVLIYRRFHAILEQHGLQPIAAVGQAFDPYLHEAILYEEGPDAQEQVVLADLQKGYKLNDRVLRPTLVKVGRGVTAPTEGAPAAETAAQEPRTVDTEPLENDKES